MEHALRQLEHAALEIQTTLAPQLRCRLDPDNNSTEDVVDLDDFSHGLRLAMTMTYDEPDQWRIRALRVVMGKLMASAFPLLLASPRWATKYRGEWGPILCGRVVADHVWLTEGTTAQQQEQPKGQKGADKGEGLVIERNELILARYEDVDLLWEEYRSQGWQPADDLMFPERGGDDPADLRPVPPVPPVLSSLQQQQASRERGRNRSKAIPIMRPDGTSITLPHSSGHHSLRRGDSQSSSSSSSSTQDGRKTASPSQHQQLVSSRAQSWPRGPRPGFLGGGGSGGGAPSTTRPPNYFAKGPGSPLKNSILPSRNASPSEEADSLDNTCRPLTTEPARDISPSSKPKQDDKQEDAETQTTSSMREEAGEQRPQDESIHQVTASSASEPTS